MNIAAALLLVQSPAWAAALVMPSSVPGVAKLAAAAEAMPAVEDESPASEVETGLTATADPDLVMMEQLKEAQSAYDKAVTELQQGRQAEGQTHMRRAFTLLTNAVEDDRLSVALQGDFLSMLEKVRTWEPEPETAPTESSPVDPTDAELKEIDATDVPRYAPGPHAIVVDPDNEITKKFIQIYTVKRPKSTEDALNRSGAYYSLIQRELAKAGLPRELFWLVMTESEYKVHAVSRSGAAGLWQFMPFTARKYGLEVSYWVDERFLPEKATVAALRYLKDLYDWFGDWHLAMAAYNRGENGLARDMNFTRSTDFETLSHRRALPGETHHYVPKWMATVLIGEKPEGYGLKVDYDKPEPYDSVALPRDLDLGIAAKAAGVELAVIQRLNPHIRAWCTPKNRADFQLRIPKGTTEAFWANLKTVENWNPGPQLVLHRVQRGDSLGKIARRYRTSVGGIAELNNIKNARLIRPGMTLKIRPGKSFFAGKN